MSRKLGRGLDVLIGKPEVAADRLAPPAEVGPAPAIRRLPVKEVEPEVRLEPKFEPEPSRKAAVVPDGPAGGDGAPESDPEARVLQLAPEDIDPNPDQPRREFGASELEMLKASIAREGLLQPVVVRAVGARYQLVAGERRLRACRELELAAVPAIVMAAADDRMLELALVENIQRENLNPLEVAVAFRQMLDTQGITQEELARALGVSRSKVGNMVRLLELPAAMKEAVAQSRISLGHAKILLSVEDASQREQLFSRIAEDNLSVRDLESEREALEEELEREGGKGVRPTRPRKPPRSPQILSLEEQLGDRLGTRVRIVEGRGKGKVVIDFYSSEDFDRLREILLS